MSNARVALLAIALLAALGFNLHNLIDLAPRDGGIDFQVFERASRDAADRVYQFQFGPFAYPPTALLLMKPLTALGYWGWIAISAFAFALSVAAVAGRRVASLSFFSPAAIKGLVHGQTPMLLGAMLFAGLRLPPFFGGILWGAAASVKPQLMLLAPLVFLVRRDWPILGGMAFGGLLMVAGTLVLLDISLWSYWIGAMPQFNRLVLDGAMIRGVTPAGIAAVAGLPMSPFLLSGLALGIAAIVVAARKVEGELLIGLVMAASLVASPYAHAYDTIALIPACVALLLRGSWWVAVPAAMIFVGTPFLTMIGLMAGLAAVIMWAIRFDRGQHERATARAF